MASHTSGPTREWLEAHPRIQHAFIPVGAAWLNLIEIALSILSRQCLDRRVPDGTTLAHEVAAWQEQRNTAATPVRWRFTTQDARVKLKHLYPSFQE